MAISDTIKKGVIRAPHRSLLRATGVIQSGGGLRQAVHRGLRTRFVQIVPGHAHLDVVGVKVRKAMYARRAASRSSSTRSASTTASRWATAG